MKLKRSYLISSIVMLGFGLMLAYAFVQLVKIERSLASFVGENMLWAVNQADRETRRFVDTLLLQHDDIKAVELRFEIMSSRINLLNSGPQLEYFRSVGAAPYLQQINRMAEQIRRRYPEALIGGRDKVLELYQDIEPVFSEFGRAENLAMLYERDARGAIRDWQLRIIYLVMAVVTGIMTVGATLFWLLILNIRSAIAANHELTEHKKELEDIVERRTVALKNALQKEQKTTEIYKGFLTTVSHQFKTPIAIIDLISQRLARYPQEVTATSVEDAARRIREAVSRLNQIIESTISSGMLDDKNVQLRLSSFDLVEMVVQCCREHKDIYRQRNIRLTFHVDEFPFRGDRTLLEQIMINLLSNAEKYSAPDLPVEVDVMSRGGQFICRVKDYGVGVPSDAEEKVFNRFFRADNVAHLAGSGLGLSIARQIAMMHKGSLRLIPVKVGPTEFELILPQESE